MSVFSKKRGKEARIRVFRNRKADLRKHIREYYIENGVAFISCNVRSYYDIIDPFSVEGYEWLNASFVRFVEENANYIPFEYPIMLEICNARFTAKQQERIEHTIREYYALKVGDTQADMRENRKKTLTLFAAGIALLILLLLLSRIVQGIGVYSREILVVFFWFCIWEAADLILYDRSDMVYDKTLYAQLESMKISFQLRFEDTPVDDEEAKQIIEEVFSEEEEPL